MSEDRVLWWDRAGQPIADVLEWAKLLEDPGYRFVALDVDDGDESCRVSTIWEGLDATFGRLGVPSIFRTAYLVGDKVVEEFQWPDEDTALEGHRIMCLEFLQREPRPEDGHLIAAIEAYRHADPS